MAQMMLFRRWMLCTLLLLLQRCGGMMVSPTPAVTSTTTKCPMFYFYDHGTENCEFCCDICCKAEVKRTSATCENVCPEYAQKLRDEAAQQLQDDAQKLDASQNDKQSKTTEFSPAAIAAIVGVALVIVLVFSLIIAKRKAIVSRFRRRAPPVTIEDQAAAVPLQPMPSCQQDVVVNLEPPDLISRRSGAGVQESGKPSGGGDNSWRILADHQSASYGTEDSREEPRAPIPESMEGRRGPKELVLPKSTFRRSDSTEPKTVRLSLTGAESRV